MLAGLLTAGLAALIFAICFVAASLYLATS